MSSALFPNYTRSAPTRDEWQAKPSDVTAALHHVETVLQGATPEDLDRLSRKAQELMREQGITFNVYHDQRGTERILPFDLIPLVISAGEWASIETGLTQRIRAWNAFHNDIYKEQEILKAGVVPFEIVYSDPNFVRECVGIKVPHDIHINVAAFDLIRDETGRWMALEDHLSNPTGASYALQNRRLLSQLCPEMLDTVPITPIYNYPTQLLETLQAAAPAGSTNARVVLLSPGIFNEAFYDHSALARQMGIPLVQGDDLIVLDTQLYLKTIGGLERVDVVYRRLDPLFMDPVSLRADSRLGVPGLLSCLRKGTVAVANSLGTGLGDNRALAAYMDEIIEFYLNEKPLLRSVKTQHCRDLDVREEIWDNWDKYVIKTVVTRGPSSIWVGGELDEAARTKLQAAITKNPGNYIAQPAIEFSTAPTWLDSKLQPRHVGIRAFVINGNKIQVTPCALTRVALNEGSLVISSGAGGGSKDTWILRDSSRKHHAPELVLRHPPRRMRLGSRTADSLFWIGRYTERAETTTRILRVIEQIRLEGDTNQNPKAWHPLWEALASATGHPTSFFKKASFQKSTSLAEYIMLDEENYASAISCLRSCRLNAQQIREALPPEVWTVLNRLYLHLALDSQEKNTARVRANLQSFTLQDDLLTGLDELAGCVEKHMLHNDAWHFWQIGRHAERAICTVLTLRQVFLKRQDERLAGGTAVTEDTNLDALLRMLAGQYAYRSSYQSRPVASQVAHLLIQDAEFPRSLVFCVESIHQALQRSFGDRPPAHAEAPMRFCNHLLSELSFADINQYFVRDSDAPPSQTVSLPRNRSKAFADWLDQIRERLFGLNTLVSDHYLNHQAASPLNAGYYPR